MQNLKLFTERLSLRPFAKSDGPRVQLLAGDERIAQTTLNIPHPYPDGLAEEWIATHEDEFINRKSVILAICTKHDDKLIGAIGIMLKHDFDRGEIGYWIGYPYWNMGFCTEACRAMIGYGFDVLKLNKIFSRHIDGNEASGKVMLKSGMQFEARLSKHVKHRGQYLDLFYYAIFRSDYKTQ